MFRKALMVLVLGFSVLAPEVVVPFANKPLIPTAEAGMCLYYAKVYYKGRSGYLGGYRTSKDAFYYARQWVLGVGSGASFRNEVFKDCR